MHATPAGRERRVDAAADRIRTIAVVLDDLIEIPGTGRRIGLKPLIGLVPWVGDVLAVIPGAWLVVEAARFRIPGIVLARMVVNLAVDFVIGLVPVLGDLVDFGLKANVRNLELFRRYAAAPDTSTREHRSFFVGLVLVLAGLLAFAVWLLIAALRWLDSIVIPAP